MNWNQKIREEKAVDSSVDLLELAMVLLKKWWLLLLAFLVGCGAAFGLTKALVNPQYTSTSTIYVIGAETTISSLADLEIGTSLTVDYQIIGKTREVLQEVIARLDLEKSPEELLREIKIENPKDSHMLRLSVTDRDPELAAQISNELAEVLSDRIALVIGEDKPSFVEKAIPSKEPSNNRIGRNTLLGGLAVLILLAVILIIRHLRDDTIQTQEDVRKYLGLTVLAEIPYDRSKKRK